MGLLLQDRSLHPRLHAVGLGDKKYDSLSVHCDWEASLEDLLPLPDPSLGEDSFLVFSAT